MDTQNLSTEHPSSTTDRHDSVTSKHKIPPPKRHLITRLLLPAVIILAILAMLGYAARDFIFPAMEVDVVRATPLNVTNPTDDTTQTSNQVEYSTVVVQAPGWIEPDPYPIHVSSLADGVVKNILTLEGETVKAGQVLVQLVEDDAKLTLAKLEADLNKLKATLAAANTNLNEPVALQRAQSVSTAQLSGAKAALVRLQAQIDKEKAKYDELDAAYKRLAAMDKASVSELQVEAAKYKAQSQLAMLNATKQLRPEMEAVINVAEAELHAANRNLQLKTDLIKARDEAQAEVDAAKVRVQEAKLRLERMTINSPVDGVVLSRLVSPGDKLMLAMDGAHSAHAIHIYDPSSLQVRVDIPLADAASVGVKQKAVIVVDVLPNIEFHGEVTRLIHQADIAKNTVQVKVAISNPSPLLKPEMLARVKFYGRAKGLQTNASVTQNNIPAGSTYVSIPNSALVSQQDNTFVWWVSPVDNKLIQRPVNLGKQITDNTVQILSGLNPGDVVVNNPANTLTQGQAVRIRNSNQ